MAHLFNKAEYFDFRGKTYTSMKKNLEASIEILSENVRQHEHPIDFNEELVLDSMHFHFYHQGSSEIFPLKLLQIDSFADILNRDVLKQHFSQAEIEELLDLVPDRRYENIVYALEGKGLYESHLQQFERKSKSGYYSSFREKEDEINRKLDDYHLKQIYQGLLNKIIRQRQTGAKKESMMDKGYKEDSAVESIEDLEVEIMSENSQATESLEEIEEEVYNQFNSKIYYKYNYSKIKTQEELLAMNEDKGDRKMAAIYKNILTVKPRNAEWVHNYRRQELNRYLNPTKPWIYNCEDGRKVTVAPVAKKISVLSGKPRDHPMLKNERPACVTILTLVRDAAARLPNGVGTRADICQLLKESQYVNEELGEEKVSNIVSGALDRLHYMGDPCVKYDSEKKLWIYLHMDRNNEHPCWGEDGDDYIEKNIGKKKKYRNIDE